MGSSVSMTGSRGVSAEGRTNSGDGTPTHMLHRYRQHIRHWSHSSNLHCPSSPVNLRRGVETIVDRLEQLELVANACHWDESTRLVNLVTRLNGQAVAFYRSCDTRKRNQCTTLVKKRFTPVHIQSSLFQDRKQKSGENVDSYAQDLKCLFYMAYPKRVPRCRTWAGLC